MLKTAWLACEKQQLSCLMKERNEREFGGREEYLNISDINKILC